MFFSVLYKIMVNKVTFAGFKGAIDPTGSAPGYFKVLGRTETVSQFFSIGLSKHSRTSLHNHHENALKPCFMAISVF